jgi:uncharacterized pyridoxal phosphate-containing UPF0001 family protein
MAAETIQRMHGKGDLHIGDNREQQGQEKASTASNPFVAERDAPR